MGQKVLQQASDSDSIDIFHTLGLQIDSCLSSSPTKTCQEFLQTLFKSIGIRTERSHVQQAP